MLDWAEQAGANECCGLLLGEHSIVKEVHLATNVAPDTTRHFEIDPSALIAAEKNARSGGLRILGYFHSHPNGRAEPSATDAAAAADDARIWLIIAGGMVSAWLPVTSGNGNLRFESHELAVEG